ncbi:MAG: hypothetical protein EAZ26_11815, partial [Runella slithyformis]
STSMFSVFYYQLLNGMLFLPNFILLTQTYDVLRRASWQITFASKNTSKQFIKYFNCLKQH